MQQRPKSAKIYVFSKGAQKNLNQAGGRAELFVMGRIFSLSTVVLLTLVETVENPFLACNDAEVACGH